MSFESKKNFKDLSTVEKKSAVVNKLLELEGSSLAEKEKITTLVNFAQTLFDIETIAVYTNFADAQINLINSKAGAKQYGKLGYILEGLTKQINLEKSNYLNALIPISELNIDNLTDDDFNTYVYPIVSPHAKQLYGIILITNGNKLNDYEEKRTFLFLLTYITKIIEEADLSFEVDSKQDKLKLLSQLSGSIRGTLKAEKAIEIVLREINAFLKLSQIYYAKWLPEQRSFEIVHEIVDFEKASLKGFTHKVTSKNPIMKLLFKNQYMTYKNKNIRRLSKVFIGTKEPSLFCMIPVQMRGELLGTIICVNTVTGREASTEDLRITQDIAGQLAVILNQSNLYEESLSTAQREFLLNSITTMIRDTLFVEEVLEKTAREIGQVFGVNACGAFLFEKGSNRIKKSIWAINDSIAEKLKIFSSSISNPILMPDPITQSIAISDLSEAKLGNLEKVINEQGLKSYLACSLVKGDETIGILVLAQFEQVRYWTSSEVQLLEAITDQVEMALSQAELHEHVQQAEKQMNLLHEVSTAIRDSLNLSDVMARAAKDLGEILSSSRCFIRRLSSSKPLTVLATEQEYIDKNQNLDKAADLILEFEKEWLESLNTLPEYERADAILHITNVDEKYSDAEEPFKSILEAIQLKSFLSIPLVARGNIIGSLCIHQCDRKRQFTQSEIDFAKRVASEASVAVLNADLFAKVEYQAQRDSLTGLFNHAYFQTALNHETERARRTGSPLSVIMLDLDYLKPINDNYGHKAGDEAIKLVAGKLEQCLRRMDIISRYGGDEFAALLPETTVDTAKQIALRILETLNRTIHPQGGPLSASIGVAGTPHEKVDEELIMTAADDAMYISKRKGRNRVTCSNDLDGMGEIKHEAIDRDWDKKK